MRKGITRTRHSRRTLRSFSALLLSREVRFATAVIFSLLFPSFAAGQGGLLAPTLLTERIGAASGGEFHGFSVGATQGSTGAVDFNGDGYQDYIVGSPFYSHPTAPFEEIYNTGKVTIYFGGPSPLPPLVIPSLARQENDLFGFSVSGAFVTNTIPITLYADFIVGAPGVDFTENGANVVDAGAAYIIRGRSNTAIAALRLLLENYDPGTVSFTGTGQVLFGAVTTGIIKLDASTAFMRDRSGCATMTPTSPQANAHFGYSVSYIGGDIGGGGNDVLVGAPYTDVGAFTDAGLTFVFGSGIAATTRLFASALSAPQPQAGALYGFSVSSSGLYHHTNLLQPAACGPGILDPPGILIGEPKRSGFLPNIGAAYVYRRHFDNLTFDVSRYELYCQLSPPSPQGGELFGFSVADIGDHTSPGEDSAFDDVIVGAPGFDSERGAAYIYGGGDLNSCDVDGCIVGENIGDRLGFAVSGGTNMDNDSNAFDEVIVGAPHYDSQNGRAYVFLGRITYPGTCVDASQADCIIDPPSGSSTPPQLGFSVSEGYNISDLNGVLTEEMIVGAPRFSSGSHTNGGWSRVITWDNGCATYREEAGTSRGEMIGFWTSAAGDWNQDNIEDVFAGAPFYDDESDRIVLSAPSISDYTPIRSVGRVVLLDGNDLSSSLAVILNPEPRQGALYGSAGVVGDFIQPNDVLDLAVGAPGFITDLGNLTGRVYVHKGIPLAQTSTPFPPRLGLPTNPDISCPAPGACHQDRNFGTNLAFWEGTDGALGWDAFLVGAPRVTGTTSGYNGYVSGYMGAATAQAITNVFRLNGATAQFGFSTLSIGDVGGSSNDDIAVGTPDGGTGGQVAIYDISGVPTVLSTISGPPTAGRFGWSLSNGDFNGDTTPDLVIGDPTGNGTGQVHVYQASGSAIFSLAGGSGSRFGESALGVASLDGDSIPELLIGIPKDNTLGGTQGRVALYSGTGSSTPLYTLAGQNPDERFGNYLTVVPATNFRFAVSAPHESPMSAGAAVSRAGRVSLYE